MNTLPQAEFDDQEPSPAEKVLEKAVRSQIWRRRIIITGGFLAIGVVFYLLVIPTTPPRHRREWIESISNAKSIGMALFSFDQDYGKYPDASTIERVRKENETLIPLGAKSSNDFFRQLLVAGYTDSEKVFYSKINGGKRPDNVMTESKALEKGECGFSYIIWADNTSTDKRPILVTPLIPGTNRFDPKPFNGKAIILRTDTSVAVVIINKKGEVIDSTGKHILDPAHPIWRGQVPVIVHPEL